MTSVAVPKTEPERFSAKDVTRMPVNVSCIAVACGLPVAPARRYTVSTGMPASSSRKTPLSKETDDVVNVRSIGALGAAWETAMPERAWPGPAGPAALDMLRYAVVTGVVDELGNRVTRSRRRSCNGELITWLTAGRTRVTRPAGMPARCSVKDATEPTAKVSTSSVFDWPFPPGVRSARLTDEIRPPVTAARRTASRSAIEEVSKLRSKCGGLVGEAAIRLDKRTELMAA